MKLLRLFSLISIPALLPVLLVSLLAAATGIGLLAASAWLIASAALMPPLYTLAVGITAVRACGIFRAVFRYGERYLSHRLAFHALTAIRVSLYQKAAAVLPLRTGPARQGEFLHDLLGGANELRDFFVRGLLPPATLFLLTAFIVSLLWQMTGPLSLLLLLLYAIRLCAPACGWQKSQPDSRRLDGAYRSGLMDSAGGAAELFFAGTSPALKILNQTAADKMQADKKAALQHDRTDTALNILDVLTLLTLMAGLIPAVAGRHLSGIDFAVYFLVLQTLLAEFRTLPEAVRQICRSQRAAGSLGPKNTKRAAVPAAVKASAVNAAEKTLLCAKDVSFSYRQGQELLRHLSFSIAKGQHTAIVGASGAGKTTLAELLLAVWPADAGMFFLLGQPYSKLTQETICRHISAMPQGSVLFAKSIRENFRVFCPDAKEEDIRQALQDAQLTKVAAAMKDGLDTKLGPNACFLSGGQRSRLLTALAISNRAPIILLDEPTCGLDKKTASDLMHALFRRVQKTGQTLLVITHDIEVTEKFAQVIRI
ncbi:thiol reductant ABC exporter subunit CydC [Mitsuokella sp. WILCCON 0060]|uniref:thiol reductant ABC exporter subunit CydC n=1 Tax=unclassified Mitsuokella TaxID=2637239 RepID=UPI003EFD1F88